MLPDNAIALLYCLVRWSCRALPPGVHNVRATIYMLSLMNLMGTVRGFGHVLAPLFLLTFTPVGAVWDPALVVDDQCTPTRTIWGAVGIERIRPRCGLRCRWRLCVARLNGSSAVACRLNVGSGSKLFQPLETPSIARGGIATPGVIVLIPGERYFLSVEMTLRYLVCSWPVDPSWYSTSIISVPSSNFATSARYIQVCP